MPGICNQQMRASSIKVFWWGAIPVIFPSATAAVRNSSAPSSECRPAVENLIHYTTAILPTILHATVEFINVNETTCKLGSTQDRHEAGSFFSSSEYGLLSRSQLSSDTQNVCDGLLQHYPQKFSARKKKKMATYLVSCLHISPYQPVHHFPKSVGDKRRRCYRAQLGQGQGLSRTAIPHNFKMVRLK